MDNVAVIYTRLSTAKSGDNKTLEDQEKTCLRLAESHGLTVAKVFAEGSGVSAYKKGVARPELDELIAYVRQRPGSTVLAWEWSRLTRRLVDLSLWIELIEEHKLRVLTPQLDTALPGQLMMLTLTAAMAQQESQTKSDRIKDGKRRQREAGRYLGGHEPAGYRHGPNGSLELHPLGADALRRAIALYVDERLALRAVCLQLNAEGHTTQSGTPWATNYLRRAILSPLTAGLIEQSDGTLMTALGLEAGGVLTAARWRDAKLRLESRSATSNKPARRPATSLLSAGILRCSNCSGGLTPERRKDSIAYRCSKRSEGKCDSGASIRSHLVEPFAVIQALYKIGAAQAAAARDDDFTDIDLIASNFRNLTNPEVDLRRNQLETELGDLLQRQETMTDLFVGGNLAAEAYERGISALTRQLETTQNALEDLPDTSKGTPLPVDGAEWLNQLAQGDITPAELPAAFQTACGSLAVARDVLASCIESITVHPHIAGKPASERLTIP